MFFAWVNEELAVHIALFVVEDAAVWKSNEHELLGSAVAVGAEQGLDLVSNDFLTLSNLMLDFDVLDADALLWANSRIKMNSITDQTFKYFHIRISAF